jgi:hypothetical protein
VARRDTASGVVEREQEAIAGVAEAVVIGVAVTRVVAIGVVAIGVAVIGVAAVIGAITITDPLASSLLATSAFRCGGAGAIRTDTTVTVTRTITTATVLATTATDMITISPVTGTAIAADQGLPSCSGDSLAPAIIVALSTGSWDHRRGEQFELTSATMEMWGD